MSLLSSTMKLPSSSEGSSSGVKIKRKSRRLRTVSPGASSMTFSQGTEEPERHQVEYEARREKTHVSRRVHRDVPSDSDAAMGDLQPSSRRRSSVVSGSSRRTPTSSQHRKSHVAAAPVMAAPTTKNQPLPNSQEASIAARRTLTPSASSVRPSNRKRLDESQLLGATDSSYRLVGRQKSSGNNSDPEEDDEETHKAQQMSSGAGPEEFSISSHENWMTGSSNNNHAATRATLPSRASKYRNLSAGVNKKPRARVPVAKELADRPPSRQRHAFPTHLIDANAFDAPETTVRRGGSSSSSASSSATSSARSSRRSSPSDCPPPDATGDRPPSRYMVKAKRHSQQETVKASRRGVVDKNSVFSCNQSHHDPKTDGFADVDESVPPPFRIEVTTDASETTLDLPSDSRSAPSSSGLNASQNPRLGRRWPTFSNQEQLLRMAVRGSDGSRGSDQAMSADLDAGQSQLQWFGKDDQIDNAHLFETIISLPSPRPALEPDVDVAIEDDLEDSEGPQYRSRQFVSKQQQPQHEPQQPVENHFPSRRAAAASKMAAPKSAISVTDNPELQWIRSSSNPFFVGSSSTVDYDSMDPETAIEQTPLYSSEDLMTLAATEMTDLHLDDYTALGDASMPIAPPPPTSGGCGGSRLPASRSPPLRTSLGKDFLSLFAQH
ncbi:uncharacterized protein KRP23_14349 [Phytophthora ramorum]|uniref:uncharacterized protein n=1 Tax=Phytophthora ramorum TaxID=164328 RepID=UPI0030B5093B|nr:hypothetical protein KRP23_14349 [Phytophthora ramorum]